MKFTNIKLADGQSGARPGQGLKRNPTYYIASAHYGIGTAVSSTTIDTDYYAVWNEWPTMTGSEGDHSNDTSGTALNDIGIAALTVRCKADHGSGTLDVAIIRKSDRKAVRVTVLGANKAHYKNGIVANGTIVAIDPDDGPWTPEIGRLVNMGYIG